MNINMTARDAAVIDVLRRKGVASLIDIAVMAKLSPSVVRNVVADLEEARLVERSGAHVLKLTRHGEALTGEAAQVLRSNAVVSSRDAEDDLAKAESEIDALIARL
jgi:Mn-dependent DtxR family transcriptional regulator